MDYEGIKVLLDRAKVLFPRLAHLWMDGGYTGVDKGAERLGTEGIRVERGDRQPSTQAGSRRGAYGVGSREWAKEGVKVN
jgi:hypothetical protein